MKKYEIPALFRQLQAEGCLDESCILNTQDGFYLAYKSLEDILAHKDILDFPDSEGNILRCSNFFDDWFLYAVPDGSGHVYSLLKLREQEHDFAGAEPADGDTPGVTICFIRFDYKVLLDCLCDPSDVNRKKLNAEVNRVVAHRGQRHHTALKYYFANPGSEGTYLTARLYTKHIAAFADNGCLPVPDQYRMLAQKYASSKCSAKDARIPHFIAWINNQSGTQVCDGEYIYIRNQEQPNEYEAAAILATHTANTSLHSFAAEVEYHARFLTPMARIRIPFIGKTIYDSAIRADMTIGDTELQGPAPFYRADSKIVKRQCALHPQK